MTRKLVHQSLWIRKQYHCSLYWRKIIYMLLHAFGGVKPKAGGGSISQPLRILFQLTSNTSYTYLNFLLQMSSFLIRSKTFKPITQVIFELRNILTFKCSEYRALGEKKGSTGLPFMLEKNPFMFYLKKAIVVRQFFLNIAQMRMLICATSTSIFESGIWIDIS